MSNAVVRTAQDSSSSEVRVYACAPGYGIADPAKLLIGKAYRVGADWRVMNGRGQLLESIGTVANRVPWGTRNKIIAAMLAEVEGLSR